jgi:tetratricopeptide (TPR) repeat protein
MKLLRRVAISTTAILTVFLMHAFSSPASADIEKISLAIFPFNNIGDDSLDMQIPALLHSKLSRESFIEIVPVEVIREKLYDIEPQYMWAEQKDAVKKGGIFWKIEPRIIERVDDMVSARFSIYGDIVRFNDSWHVDVYFMREHDPDSEKSFRLAGVRGDDIPLKMGDIAKAIADLLREEYIVSVAEEEMRLTVGGISSYDAAIQKLERYVNDYPGSVPLRALLLDLCLKEKDTHIDSIMDNGLTIMKLLEQRNEDGRRYLLSLSLDPFDTVAGVYEKRKKWEDAISVRNNALRVFLFNERLHKKALGEDYYRLAAESEIKGGQAKAAEQYKKAIEYLDPSSEYYRMAVERMKRLSGPSGH